MNHESETGRRAATEDFEQSLHDLESLFVADDHQAESSILDPETLAAVGEELVDSVHDDAIAPDDEN